MTFAKSLSGLASGGIGIAPVSLVSTSGTGVWAKMEAARALGVVAYCGAIAGGGSVTFKLQQASDASGTGAADVAGYTTLITYADTDDSLVKTAEIKQGDIATIAASAKPYMALVATTASATVVVSAAVVKLDPVVAG